MASWAALNADAPRATPEDLRVAATEEAQEARLASLYDRALRLQQQKKVDDACAIYGELLEASSGLSSRLRYLCAKNLATLEAERKAFDVALRRFAEALALDGTDVIVWYQMGKAAVAMGQLWLARQAFESGFQVDSSFWPLVHALCDVLHAIGDGTEYARVATLILERDPEAALPGGPLYAIDTAVEPEFRVCRSTGHPDPRKRPTQAAEASTAASKRRKVELERLHEEIQVAANRAPLQYQLQHSSWLSLGKLLLGAYEDVTSEEKTSGQLAKRSVLLEVAFVEESPAPPPPPPVQPVTNTDNTSAQSVAPPDPAEQPSGDLVDLTAEDALSKPCKGTVASEPIEIDQVDDMDNEDGNGEPTAHRRKSRRHEEKLREEHEQAAKEAREKNLAYRLEVFLPSCGGEQNMSQHRETIFRIIGESVELEYVDGAVLASFANVLPSAPSNEPLDSSDPTIRQTAEIDSEGGLKLLVREDISEFVRKTMGESRNSDIVQLLRGYLNQCGEWADKLVMKVEGEDVINPICLWAERVVCGRLDSNPATIPGQKHEGLSRVTLNSRLDRGLNFRARLFLLELHLDELTHQHSQQGSSRSRKRQRSYFARLDEIIEDAQALLLDVCWNETALGEFDEERRLWSAFHARLFWLCGCAFGYRGHATAAKEYFTKCKQALGELEQSALLHLPNLRIPAKISSATVDEKIIGLQYSDVCSEAQEMTTSSRFDEAQRKLLSHFFPTNGQDSRMDELLEDFSSRQRDENRGDGDASEKTSNLLELLLGSVENSASSTRSDKIMILLVILSRLVDVVCVARENITAFLRSSDESKHKVATAVSAIELTVDRLASVVSSETDSDLSLNTKQAVMAVVTLLLQPKILLLFDSPRDVLQVIYEIQDQLTGASGESTEAVLGPLLVATAKSFRSIRSLTFQERERLLGVPFTAGAAKWKKKQSVRHERIRQFFQSALALMAAHARLLVTVLAAADIRGLMEDCCPLLKEEEDTVRRRHESDKTARKILTAGAVLFLQLVAILPSPNSETEASLKSVVGLVELLHARLAQHELCAQQCFDKHITRGDCVGDTFVEVAAHILSDRQSDHEKLQQARRVFGKGPTKRSRSSEKSDNEDDNASVGEPAEEDGDDGENEDDSFEVELAQCYRCLYDVHIHQGCVDHKTGSSIANLEAATSAEALRLAQFAIPMLLKQPPRSNTQKKENLKVMFAIQRSIDFAQASLLPSVEPGSELLKYLAPRSLLSWTADVPTLTQRQRTPRQDSCLEHLWYLLGENFILLRVRRRSNLSELIELERKIKERIAFLLKDVQYYRPRRIKSWLRLGRSMKELYQVVSDACALVLGRKWRKKTLLVASSDSGIAAPGSFTEILDDGPTFDDVVIRSSLFERMKEWHDLDESLQKANYRVHFGHSVESIESDGAEGFRASRHEVALTIEQTAETYMVQVAEFSRRCFEMAGTLATEGLATKSMEDSDANLDEMAQVAVEAYEDCGLLLYNQLQEFAALRRDDGVIASHQFPATLYSRVLQATLDCFHAGVRTSEAKNPESHEVRFRLHYMIGKLMKKQLWLQRQLGSVAKEATTGDILSAFAKAEQEHEDGKMDRSVVHAFYQLQAVRLGVILATPPVAADLRLACDHFFEEDSSDAEDVEDMESEEKTEETLQVKVSKEDVAAIILLGERENSNGHLELAQGWLFYNIIDALESISDEDRYFHASRFTLAKAMYHYNEIIERLSSLSDIVLPSSACSATACISILAKRKTKKKNDGTTPADIALKEMQPLFDKRRPQVVAIWLSEHVPTSKKFEELNQRQIKFDFCRLKYLRFLVKLLQEDQAYGRLKEIGTWVLACKEEHDAIDEMLGCVLFARSVAQQSRLREFVGDLVDQLKRYRQKQTDQQTQLAEAEDVEVNAHLIKSKELNELDSPADSLMKELGKAYVNYLDLSHARIRLVDVMTEETLQELFMLAEFPLVFLYLLGVTEFPTVFEFLEQDEAVSTATELMPTIRAMLCNGEPCTLSASADWRPFALRARLFCESRWPDRQSGKTAGSNKQARKPRPAKSASAHATATSATAPDPGQAVHTEGPPEADPAVLGAVGANVQLPSPTKSPPREL